MPVFIKKTSVNCEENTILQVRKYAIIMSSVSELAECESDFAQKSSWSRELTALFVPEVWLTQTWHDQVFLIPTGSNESTRV